MLQQINLYYYLPKKRQSLLTAPFILSAYGLFSLFLLMLHLISIGQKYELQDEVNHVMLNLAQDQQHLTQLSARYPTTQLDELEKSIDALEVTAKHSAMKLDMLAFDAHYAQYLQAFGNAILPGVWLTEIEFNRYHDRVILKGHSLKSEILARFYNRLIKQAVFANLIFTVQEMKQTSMPTSFIITGKKRTTL